MLYSVNKSEAGKLGAQVSSKTWANIRRKNEENYHLSPKLCKNCNIVLSYDDFLKKKSFCNRSCSASFNNSSKIKNKSTYNCLNCKIECLNSKSSKNKFCSILCFNDHRIFTKILEKKASARTMKKFLIKNYGYKCWACGISEWQNKPITLELEHMDGNSDNNDESNLSLLCPNCHSQTPTYKYKNKGNGRYFRRERYKEGKSF